LAFFALGSGQWWWTVFGSRGPNRISHSIPWQYNFLGEKQKKTNPHPVDRVVGGSRVDWEHFFRRFAPPGTPHLKCGLSPISVSFTDERAARKKPTWDSDYIPNASRLLLRAWAWRQRFMGIGCRSCRRHQGIILERFLANSSRFCEEIPPSPDQGKIHIRAE